MAQENTDLIIGLKTNCKKGYNLADFYERIYIKSIRTLLKSWKLIKDKDAVSELAWETVSTHKHYKTIDSFRIGIYSHIGIMIISEKTYTTKKGEIKILPEEHILSHYTKAGQYLGRVSNLGDKPISYSISLHITSKHFEFIKVADTLENCFAVKNEIWIEGEYETKEVSKAELKESVKK